MRFKTVYTIIIIIFLITLLNLLGLFDALNSKIYNQFIYINQKKNVNNEIVLVLIDSKSIQQVGYWPWSRKEYTKILKTIMAQKPRVIGVSLSFTETQGKPEEDKELYDTLKTFPNVVLAAKLVTYSQDNIKRLVIPQKSIFPEIKQGHTGMNFSEKGVVNSFPIKVVIPAFALDVVRLYYTTNQNKISSRAGDKLIYLLSLLGKNDQYMNVNLLIDYKRTPDKFIQLSFINVLENKIPADIFKDKIVLIGVSDKYIAKEFATPFTDIKDLTSSDVELQAQIIDSLINFRGLFKAPEWLLYLFALISGLLFFYLSRAKRIVVQGLYFLVFILLTLFVDYWLFTSLNLWLPPTMILFLILAIFGFSLYSTTSTIDDNLINAFNKLNQSKNIPMVDLPSDLGSRVKSLTDLLEIINTDRLTIKAIIDGVNNGIIVFDESGKIIWANGYITSLYKEHLILNENITDIIEDIDFKQIMVELQNNNSYQIFVGIKQFDFCCVISTISTMPKQYVAVFNDVTELKNMDRLKTDMVRIVSHELKSPLVAIQICADNISFIDDKNSIQENSQRIINSTNILLDTIDNFLNLSRLENNMVEMNIKKSNLIDLINKSIELQEPVAENRNIKLIFEHQGIAEVLMDSKHILIVLNNLISNAIKYSFENSEIIIKTVLNNGYVTTSIKDSGIGIPKEDLEKIFDKFYRSINNKKYSIKGTGLGLSIIKKIITIHNGDIKVESEYEKGSTFSFSLPISDLPT